MLIKPCGECVWSLPFPGFKSTSGSVVYCCHTKARSSTVTLLTTRVREDVRMCGPAGNWYKSIPPEDLDIGVRGLGPKTQRIIAPQYTTPRKALYKVPT